MISTSTVTTRRRPARGSSCERVCVRESELISGCARERERESERIRGCVCVRERIEHKHGLLRVQGVREGVCEREPEDKRVCV